MCGPNAREIRPLACSACTYAGSALSRANLLLAHQDSPRSVRCPIPRQAPPGMCTGIYNIPTRVRSRVHERLLRRWTSRTDHRSARWTITSCSWRASDHGVNPRAVRGVRSDGGVDPSGPAVGRERVRRDLGDGPWQTQGPRTAEQRRLRAEPSPEHDGLAPDDWNRWGPYLAERAWGSVREDYSESGDAWVVVPPRSRAVAGVPVERGRARRASATSASGCASRSALWNGTRPDPEGTDLRADRPGGQPRRGRQGVLVVPRRAAQPRLAAVALPLPAGRRSPTTCSSPRTGAAGSTTPSSSCSTPACSTRTATGRSRSTYAKASPDDIVMRIIVDEPRPRRPRSCTCCRRCGSATRGRWGGGPARPDRRLRLAADAIAGRPRRRPSPTSCVAAAGPDGRPGRRCSARTRPTRPRLFGTAPTTRVPEGRDQRPRRVRARHREPGADGHEGGVVVPGDGPGRGAGGAAAALRRVDTAEHGGDSASGTIGRRRRACSARSTTTVIDRACRGGRRVLRRARCRAGTRSRRRQGGAPGERRAGLEQAVLPVPRGALARRRPGSARRPRRRTDTAATRAGGTSTPTTSSPCPTRGSTRGSRRGTSPSTPSPGPTSIPRSRSTRCSCCCASGSSTRTAPCPRTSGASTTSTRRCTPSPRSASSSSTASDDCRLPRAGLPQAAAQLHVVAQPTGPRRQQPLRRRLPRARQHQPDRPVAPPARCDARAGRRLGVDGLQHAGDVGDRGAARRGGPGLRRSRRHVPRTVHDDHAGGEQLGPLRPRARASSTTSSRPPTGRNGSRSRPSAAPSRSSPPVTLRAPARRRAAERPCATARRASCEREQADARAARSARAAPTRRRRAPSCW